MDPETLGIVHIWVIINKNPIFAVLCLIGLVGSISTYLIFIGLIYLGLAYIIIYLGAVEINSYCIWLKFGTTRSFLCLLALKIYFYIVNFSFKYLWTKQEIEVFYRTGLGIIKPVYFKGIEKEKKRYYSTSQSISTNKEPHYDFYEWLCGFTDAEGCFRIKKRFKKNKFSVYFWVYIVYPLYRRRYTLFYSTKIKYRKNKFSKNIQ